MRQQINVLAALRSAVSEWDLAGAPVLVAVSGGPDSLTLLHALHQLGPLALAAAHFDHGLRSESAAEAQLVVDFCRTLDIPCYVDTAAPGSIAASNAGSLQQSARAARYAFLRRIAADIGARYIATGHNRDDQVETVLINILRGTGIDGLSGIPRQHGNIIRPLLDVPRAAIEAYCLEHNLTPRHDPSNDDPSHYLRNRIRLELLPMLERDYHPGASANLLRLSESAAIDSAYLESQARLLYDAIAVDTGLDADALTALPLALRRRVIRLTIERARGTRDGIEERHVELALALASGDRSDGFTIPDPDCRIRRSGAILVVETPAPPSTRAPYSVPLALNSTVELPNGWTISVSDQPLSSDDSAYTATFDVDRIDLATLTVRSRLAGDKIDPLGMGGKSKKLQDLFVDAKISKDRRDDWPVIVDKKRLLWVPGLTQAERAKITDSTVARLSISAVKIANPTESSS